MTQPNARPKARRYWSELTTGEIGRLDPETLVVLPLGAVEQHGPHLPLDTDGVIGRGILDAALDRLPETVPCVALPWLPIGHSPEHGTFPGTLSLTPEMLLAHLRSMGEAVAEAGLRRLVPFTSHGGNPPLLDLLAVDLRARLGMLVAPVHYGRFGLPEGVIDEEEARWGIHGGQLETALMLALRPDLVRTTELRLFESAASAFAVAHPGLSLHRLGWAAEDLNVAGVVGDAAAATAEQGRVILEHLAEAFARFLIQVARIDLAGRTQGPIFAGPRDPSTGHA